jgi:hypothetical protein
MDFAKQFDEAERRHLGAAAESLPALGIAHRATGTLAAQIEGAQTPPAPEKPPPAFYIREAIFLLAVIGLRTARACILVVSAGYTPEAHGLKRRLSEVHARAHAVRDDKSGEHARQWLEDGPSKPSKLFSKYGSLDLWKLYSWGAHADAESPRQWLSVPMPEVAEGHTGIVVGPHFDEHLSNALLVECAMECRDLAMAQAWTRGSSSKDELKARYQRIAYELDGEIDAMAERYYAPVEAGPATFEEEPPQTDDPD